MVVFSLQTWKFEGTQTHKHWQISSHPFEHVVVMQEWGYPKWETDYQTLDFLGRLWETHPWSVPRSGSILSTKKTQRWAEKPWLILVDELFIGVILCYTLWFIVDHTPRGVHPYFIQQQFSGLSLQVATPWKWAVPKTAGVPGKTGRWGHGKWKPNLQYRSASQRTGASVDTNMVP